MKPFFTTAERPTAKYVFPIKSVSRYVFPEKNAFEDYGPELLLITILRKATGYTYLRPFYFIF